MVRLTVHAIITGDGGERAITVKGQTARALMALVEAGLKGRTALEVSTWAYRFSAYCFDLRHLHGLSIRTDREEHPGGWHGRHVLENTVRIVAVEGDDRRAA